MAERRIGRPSKGPRKRLEIRVPIGLAEAIEVAAEHDGLDMTTWVTEVVAHRLGYPYPQQERLPLTNAA